MKQLFLLTMCVALFLSACSKGNVEENTKPKTQEKMEQKEMKPEDTEVWDPEPKVVTPVYGQSVPSDAIVLFDGSNLDEWVGVEDGSPAKWDIGKKDKSMTVVSKTGNIMTKRDFGDIQLHIEWRTPKVVAGDSQQRGNSGVYLQNRYEIQVLDSYENRTYANGQAGALYKQHPPLVNASKKPGEWQSYDIIFHAPKFNEKGEKVKSGVITVFQNGVLVQDGVEILGTTEYIGSPKNEAHGNAPIQLQDHGNPTSFRNIWVREL